ncbi:hypothetical protein ACO22_03877 [Paracoccidioides brasiliensis]|uniref:Uncharacterized protein n=1 Tax=Paracoccidioides brasiliensis TaxID=121759 RepID=A0A1D2JEX9_PARBR|nr:hypothetical protein ACO22_03877 [Paracoccidioides brasiliensis]
MDPSAHDKRGVIIHARARIQRFPRIPARGDIAIHHLLVLGGLSPETSCLWATMSDGFAATNMPIDRRVMTKESTYVRLEQTSLIRNISGLNLMMTAHGREGMQFRDPRDHGEIIQKAKLLDNCSELDFDGSKKERVKALYFYSIQIFQIHRSKCQVSFAFHVLPDFAEKSE